MGIGLPIKLKHNRGRRAGQALPRADSSSRAPFVPRQSPIPKRPEGAQHAGPAHRPRCSTQEKPNLRKGRHTFEPRKRRTPCRSRTPSLTAFAAAPFGVREVALAFLTTAISRRREMTHHCRKRLHRRFAASHDSLSVSARGAEHRCGRKSVDGAGAVCAHNGHPKTLRHGSSVSIYLCGLYESRPAWQCITQSLDVRASLCSQARRNLARINPFKEEIARFEARAGSPTPSGAAD